MIDNLSIKTEFFGLNKLDVDRYIEEMINEYKKSLRNLQKEIKILERTKEKLLLELEQVKKNQQEIIYEDQPTPNNSSIHKENTQKRLTKTVALINQIADQRIDSMMEKAMISIEDYDKELDRLKYEIEENREKIENLLEEVIDLIKNNIADNKDQKQEQQSSISQETAKKHQSDNIIELFKPKQAETAPLVSTEVKSTVDKKLENYENTKGEFIEKIDEFIALDTDDGQSGAVLLLELNEFIMVNYFINCSSGNTLVGIITEMIKTLNKDILIERLNYDQIGIILYGVSDTQEIGLFAKTVLRNIQKNIYLENKKVEMAANIGIALYSKKLNNAAMIMNYAGIALFKAKEEGKGLYRFIDEELINKVKFSNDLKSDLMSAIENNEFELYYQPQFCAKTNEIMGFEALLRWQNYKYKKMSILDVIQLAEKENMIDEIGYYLFRKACQFARQVENKIAQRVIVSVNFSPVQLKQEDFMDSIKAIIKETNASPSYIGVEITESCFMENFEETCNKLLQIKNLGITISIDDFGVGYSTLSYLLKMPVSIIKIDKTFLDDLTTSKRTEIFLNSIIDITHNLGFQVIAEGVENEKQYEMLKKMGCDYFQGYYLAKPAPENEAYMYLLNS